MYKDECIIVDDKDSILGHKSKYDAHKFTNLKPDGMLHRAFSVFLFNADGRLLLQKRAASKITFPSVWTNTCCSHPLYGYAPSEVDSEEAVKSGEVDGIKRAAIRKLQHELGIDTDTFQLSDFKYLTRLHYSAPDEFTRDSSVVSAATKSGENENESFVCWGESEVDYILFVQCKNDVKLNPNEDEIEEVKYVTLQELQSMMSTEGESGDILRWSPWFRIIADNFLTKWWQDLDTTFNTDTFVDLGTIHRLA